MHTHSFTGPETAAQLSALNADQIAGLLAIMNAGNQQVFNPASSDVQEESTDEKADGTDTAITVTVDELRTAFEAAMVSDIYLGNPKRLARLLESLKIPMANEKDYNQFLNHALKDLKVLAADKAFKTGEAIVMPTEEQIITEAKKRLAAKILKEQEKAAKKIK